jgi:hypothetical protein
MAVGQALSFAPHYRAGFMREGQPRQSDQRLQMRMSSIHVGTDHGQCDLVPRFVLRDFQVGRAKALVVAFSARNLLLQGLHPGVFSTAVAHHDAAFLSVISFTLALSSAL